MNHGAVLGLGFRLRVGPGTYSWSTVPGSRWLEESGTRNIMYVIDHAVRSVHQSNKMPTMKTQTPSINSTYVFYSYMLIEW